MNESRELQRIGTAHSAGVFKKRFSIRWSKFLLYCDLRYLSTTEKMPHCRVQAHYEHLSKFERGRITELKEAAMNTHFQLCPDDNRRTGQRANPAFTIARHVGPQSSVMVWGVISFDDRTPLVVIRGTFTSQLYVDDILRTI
ncbi:transposable element Tc1 transposase [Trichonephila clavipes]|nr:transposable element Tc1 transposase [Trichonephila clavipes]